jgi:hypothetical protein
MTTHNGSSSETEYDNILNKLDALLHKHQGKSQPLAGGDGNAESLHNIIPGGIPATDVSGSASNIPTLTEAVILTSGMLSSQSDITAILSQIVDSALRDAGTSLNADAHKALVQALESRLFGL